MKNLIFVGTALISIAGCATTDAPSIYDGPTQEAYKAPASAFPPMSAEEVRSIRSALMAQEMARLDLDARAEQIEAAQEFPLGSWRNPVRAEMPPGQQEYLNRLRCSDGSAPTYERRGNLGEGVFGTIVDIYDLSCGSAEPATAEVVMDMYHEGYTEFEAVPGFDIVLVDTSQMPAT